MKAKLTCPLGSECERISNGELERCAWYLCIEGEKDGEKTSESKCAMTWMPQIAVNGMVATKGVQAAIESGRNTLIGLAKNGTKAIKDSTS